MFAPDQVPPIPPRRLRSALFAVAVAALLLPDCGGSSPTVPPASTTPAPPPATAPPAPTTLADLSATVTSAQADASLNCSDDLRARVTLVNNGGIDVAVRGVLKRSGTVTGDCTGDHDFTYVPSRGIAPAKTSTIVLDGSLYSGGLGCCDGKGCGGSCRFQDGFEVMTSVGNVPAGAINYKVFYQNCRSCAATAASAGGAGCTRKVDLPAR